MTAADYRALLLWYLLAMFVLILLLLATAYVTAQEVMQSTVCAQAVPCDGKIKDSMGVDHKYGDYLSDCLDPRTKYTVMLTPGACEKSVQVKERRGFWASVGHFFRKLVIA